MVFLRDLEFDTYDWLLWITTAEFVFRWEGREYRIPLGFVLDFYSIPMFLWWWRKPYQEAHNEAALVHDFLRRFRGYFGLSVKDTDRAFLAAMIATGMDRGTAKRKHRWVRLAWLFTYNRGRGKPVRGIRKAMAERDYDWRAYRRAVLQANGVSLEVLK